ncbi:hypothetical protein JGU66_08830 [Myxococcaceae bacterium JPH2]|nr:hypothetical protein [Myxococcaceae bacterium JPH2]
MSSRLPVAFLSLCLLSASLPARAQQAANSDSAAMDAPMAPKPLEAAANEPVPSSQTPAGQEPSLDFDLLQPAEEAAQADPELDRRIKRRRTMLKLHQGLGLAMAGGLATTTVLGQLQFSRSFRGGEDNRALLAWHKGFVIGTSALFATVGALGLLAPEPIEKKFQWDTVTFHKLFMGLATAGMLTQAVLGILAVHDYGKLSEVNLATAHQVVGYMTLGAVVAGVVSLTF